MRPDDQAPTRPPNRRPLLARGARMAGSNREGTGSQRAARRSQEDRGGIRARDEEGKAGEKLTGARASVYRHYDKDGALLYVGVSLFAISRLRE